MKYKYSFAGSSALVCLILTFLLGSSAAWAGPKVEVCHVPPGNPANFHTITVSEKAFSAHLAHGDLAGACNQMCATLCDDGNACTIDDTGDCEQNGCPASPVAVSCDDGNVCTSDSCEPTQGCMNTPEQGLACDDEMTCTAGDTCNDQGACVGTQVPNCCTLEDASECSQNLCDQASCNTLTNECENDPVSCTPSDLCHVSVCDAGDGTCAETPVTCAADETCSLTSGECEPTIDVGACPCANLSFGNYNLSFPAASCSLIDTGAYPTYSATAADGSRIMAYIGWVAPGTSQCQVLGNGYKINYPLGSAADHACRAIVQAVCP